MDEFGDDIGKCVKLLVPDLTTSKAFKHDATFCLLTFIISKLSCQCGHP